MSVAVIEPDKSLNTNQAGKPLFLESIGEEYINPINQLVKMPITVKEAQSSRRGTELIVNIKTSKPPLNDKSKNEGSPSPSFILREMFKDKVNNQP